MDRRYRRILSLKISMERKSGSTSNLVRGMIGIYIGFLMIELLLSPSPVSKSSRLRRLMLESYTLYIFVLTGWFGWMVQEVALKNHGNNGLALLHAFSLGGVP